MHGKQHHCGAPLCKAHGKECEPPLFFTLSSLVFVFYALQKIQNSSLVFIVRRASKRTTMNFDCRALAS
jgi:hypothetical protein